MKSNNFKNRLTALALCFTLLLGAAPITRAYAVNDESDTSSSQSDSDSANTSSTDSGSTDSADSKDSKDTKDATADNDKDVTAAASEAPAVTATAALLISPDSDMVLYEKNADEKRYPASTTKIMTALLTLENVEDLNETVTAEQGRLRQGHIGQLERRHQGRRDRARHRPAVCAYASLPQTRRRTCSRAMSAARASTLWT